MNKFFWILSFKNNLKNVFFSFNFVIIVVFKIYTNLKTKRKKHYEKKWNKYVLVKICTCKCLVNISNRIWMTKIKFRNEYLKAKLHPKEPKNKHFKKKWNSGGKENLERIHWN